MPPKVPFAVNAPLQPVPPVQTNAWYLSQAKKVLDSYDDSILPSQSFNPLGILYFFPD